MYGVLTHAESSSETGIDKEEFSTLVRQVIKDREVISDRPALLVGWRRGSHSRAPSTHLQVALSMVLHLWWDGAWAFSNAVM